MLDGQTDFLVDNTAPLLSECLNSNQDRGESSIPVAIALMIVCCCLGVIAVHAFAVHEPTLEHVVTWAVCWEEAVSCKRDTCAALASDCTCPSYSCRVVARRMLALLSVTSLDVCRRYKSAHEVASTI